MKKEEGRRKWNKRSINLKQIQMFVLKKNYFGVFFFVFQFVITNSDHLTMNPIFSLCEFIFVKDRCKFYIRVWSPISFKSSRNFLIMYLWVWKQKLSQSQLCDRCCVTDELSVTYEWILLLNGWLTGNI